MGFSFGFIEDIEENVDLNNNIKNGNSIEFINPIDSLTDIHQPPKLHCLSEILLPSFLDTRITYEPVNILNGMILYRRELFDIRHQLMMEDDNLNNKANQSIEEFNILIGETGEDLKNGIYEGGLKSWECSFDMIDKLDNLQIVNNLLNENEKINVIELGCGTSLPTLYILKLIFETKLENRKPLSIVLSDFNYDVLRLVTVPNILINWCFSVLSSEELIELQKRGNVEGNIRNGEIDITQSIIEKFQEWLASNKIEISFISGSWCRNFMEIIQNLLPNFQNDANIVLTSETIYSPSILPVISEIMIELTNSNQNSVSLLSAKDIYFGVGGSIVECRKYLESRAMKIQSTAIPGNLKRSVLAITK